MTADLPAIGDLVPHAGAMVLLERVAQWDDESILCLTESHHLADNPLRRGDQLPALAGVEYAAQAVAVHGSLTGHDAAGYLAALRHVRCRVSRLDDVAGPLRVAARCRLVDGRALVYGFEVSGMAGDRVLIEGQLSIMLSGEGT